MSDSKAVPPKRKPEARSVLCPRCGKEICWTADFPFRPFCSERCKLIDLGQWACEQYRIPAEPEPDDQVDSEAGARDI